LLFILGLQLSAAVILSLLLPTLDLQLHTSFADTWLGWLAMRPESTQALLATLAGALMTVASIVFSVTVVTAA